MSPSVFKKGIPKPWTSEVGSLFCSLITVWFRVGGDGSVPEVMEGPAGWWRGSVVSSVEPPSALNGSCVARAQAAGRGKEDEDKRCASEEWDGSCLSLPPHRAGEILVLGSCRGAGTEHVRRGLLFKKGSVDSVGD